MESSGASPSQMGILLRLLMAVCFIMMQGDSIMAQVSEWKMATATYSKQTDGSIITGTPFFLCFSVILLSPFLSLPCLSFCVKLQISEALH